MKWMAGLLGAIGGYYAIAYPSCTWFWPESNLCGIWSPVGAIAGAAGAYWIASRTKF
jgi:hypothetical protein